MKHLNLLIAIISILCLSSCTQQELLASHETTPEEMVTQIKKTGKLYVTEYVVEKLVTANDQNTVKGSVFGKSISVDMSIGERKIAIPMKAILKAYVDFDSLKVDDITLTDNPRAIKLFIDEPKVELTSSKIDHQAIKEYTGIFRASFKDSEMSNYEQQGRAAIIESIPDMGIINTAKTNAKETLIPILMQAGFEPEHIQIDFKPSKN